MSTQTLVHPYDIDQDTPSTQRHSILPFTLLFAMVCAILLIDAVLPLRGLWFFNALLTRPNSPLLLPMHLLFPGWASSPVQPVVGKVYATTPGPLPLSVQETWILCGTFLALFAVYLLALRYLPQYISRRYILISAALLGLTYMLIPVITSQDVFSYIAYARMGVLYHLNPLTTLPISIATDPVFSRIYWIRQPSAYGPTWAIITCVMQWLALAFGPKHLVPMVLLLRLLGLAMHLGSVQLIWSISGHLQRLNGSSSLRTRLLATFAFAWNPLLLFEACVNAHNDTTLLFLILLAIWFLLPRRGIMSQAYLLSAATLAIATCLKINIVLLVPGLGLFLWARPSRRISSTVFSALTYGGVILLLYAGFWQHGEILRIFQINPGAYRAINTPAEFLGRLYNGIIGAPDYPSGFVSLPERFSHTVSMALFLVIYGVFCIRPLFTSYRLNSLSQLLHWMAFAWLLYCAIGSPWSWPWYTITFFGLSALIEATTPNEQLLFGMVRLPLAVRLLAFSMFSVYCLLSWGPIVSFVPGLHYFKWAYFRGLWAWALPLLALRWRPQSHRFSSPLLLPVQKTDRVITYPIEPREMAEQDTSEWIAREQQESSRA